MPWIFNPNRHAEQIVKSNGDVGSLPGRKKVYIKPDEMSAMIAAKIQSGRLMKAGGDPGPRPLGKATSAPVVVKDIEVISDTSSDLHVDSAIVQTDSMQEMPASPNEDNSAKDDPATSNMSGEVEVAESEAGIEESPLIDSTETNDPEKPYKSRRSRRGR